MNLQSAFWVDYGYAEVIPVKPTAHCFRLADKPETVELYASNCGGKIVTARLMFFAAFSLVPRRRSYGFRGTNDSIGGIEKDVVKACSGGWFPS